MRILPLPPCVFVSLLLGLAAAEPVQCATHVVTINSANFSYTPAQLTIARGDTVQFEASGFHPLRSDDGLFSCGADCDVTFSEPGDYGFFCFNHGGAGGSGMSGLVLVIDPDFVFANGFETPN